MYRKTLMILAAGALLSACSSLSAHSVNTHFVGQDANAFFMEYGGPRDMFKLADGGKIYTWYGGYKSYQMPTTTQINMNPTFGGGYMGTATTYAGGTLEIQCAADIQTDKDNKIQSIRFVQDTLGRWTTSRCAEVFGF